MRVYLYATVSDVRYIPPVTMSSRDYFDIDNIVADDAEILAAPIFDGFHGTNGGKQTNPSTSTTVTQTTVSEVTHAPLLHQHDASCVFTDQGTSASTTITHTVTTATSTVTEAHEASELESAAPLNVSESEDDVSGIHGEAEEHQKDANNTRPSGNLEECKDDDNNACPSNQTEAIVERTVPEEHNNKGNNAFPANQVETVIERAVSEKTVASKSSSFALNDTHVDCTTTVSEPPTPVRGVIEEDPKNGLTILDPSSQLVFNSVHTTDIISKVQGGEPVSSVAILPSIVTTLGVIVTSTSSSSNALIIGNVSDEQVTAAVPLATPAVPIDTPILPIGASVLVVSTKENTACIVSASIATLATISAGTPVTNVLTTKTSAIIDNTFGNSTRIESSADPVRPLPGESFICFNHFYIYILYFYIYIFPSRCWCYLQCYA